MLPEDSVTKILSDLFHAWFTKVLWEVTSENRRKWEQLCDIIIEVPVKNRVPSSWLSEITLARRVSLEYDQMTTNERSAAKAELGSQNTKLFRLFHNLPLGLALLEEMERHDEMEAQEKCHRDELYNSLEMAKSVKKDGKFMVNRAIAILPDRKKKLANY